MNASRILYFLVCFFLVSGSFGLLTAGKAEYKEDDTSVLDNFDPDQLEKLLAGETVFEHVEMTGSDGKIRGQGKAAVLINAPVEECFRIFCEFDKMQEYLPRKTKSEVIRSSEGEVLVYKQLKFLIKTIEFTSRYIVDPKAHRVEFELVPDLPHDIKDSAGYYQFDPVDQNRTLFSYGLTRMDSGIRVPGFIQKHMTSRDLPNVVRSVKKRIESGGTWTKD